MIKKTKTTHLYTDIKTPKTTHEYNEIQTPTNISN